MKIKSILKFIVIILSFHLTACNKPKIEPPPFKPGDEFFKIYQQIKETEKLENKITEFKSGSLGTEKDIANHLNINLAIQQYNIIKSKLLEIKRKDPYWNPFIIDYRLKKTSEAIERLKQKYNDIAHKRYIENTNNQNMAKE